MPHWLHSLDLGIQLQLAQAARGNLRGEQSLCDLCGPGELRLVRQPLRAGRGRRQQQWLPVH